MITSFLILFYYCLSPEEAFQTAKRPWTVASSPSITNTGDDNTGGSLEDGEQLITEESFVYGNTAINSGDTVATLVGDLLILSY